MSKDTKLCKTWTQLNSQEWRWNKDKTQVFFVLYNIYPIFSVFNALDELAELNERVKVISGSDETYVAWAEQWLEEHPNDRRLLLPSERNTTQGRPRQIENEHDISVDEVNFDNWLLIWLSFFDSTSFLVEFCLWL